MHPLHRFAVGLTAAVAKTSAGALAHMPVVRIANLVRAIEELKEAGFWVLGLDLECHQTVYNTDMVRPLAIVIGSESKGIGRLVAKHCDFVANIPMVGKTESLNASVAAGIVFYEVLRQNLLH